MKFEWRKHDACLKNVKQQPVIVQIPKRQFLMVKGTGDPNQEAFANCVQVLYSLSYQVKNCFKRDCFGKNVMYEDYSVFPLEGIWTSNGSSLSDKDQYEYMLMIQQPDMVNVTLMNEAMELVRKKKPHPLLDDVILYTMEEQPCVQCLHIGSYDDEPQTFHNMNTYIEDVGYTRKQMEYHQEIYLNDARKTIPEKRRTILRYTVQPL